MKIAVLVSLIFSLGAQVSGTLDPATGHAIGKKPTDSWIASVSPKASSGIQDAECSHNTRLANQKFAWFKIDPSKVNQKGSTYGTCYATSEAPSQNQLEANSQYDCFFWQNSGGDSGVGTGPIKDPNTGQPGYEDNSGTFHLGSSGSDSTSSQGTTASTSGNSRGTKTGSKNGVRSGTRGEGQGTTSSPKVGTRSETDSITSKNTDSYIWKRHGGTADRKTDVSH